MMALVIPSLPPLPPGSFLLVSYFWITFLNNLRTFLFCETQSVDNTLSQYFQYWDSQLTCLSICLHAQAVPSICYLYSNALFYVHPVFIRHNLNVPNEDYPNIKICKIMYQVSWSLDSVLRTAIVQTELLSVQVASWTTNKFIHLEVINTK